MSIQIFNKIHSEVVLASKDYVAPKVIESPLPGYKPSNYLYSYLAGFLRDKLAIKLSDRDISPDGDILKILNHMHSHIQKTRRYPTPYSDVYVPYSFRDVVEAVIYTNGFVLGPAPTPCLKTQTDETVALLKEIYPTIKNWPIHPKPPKPWVLPYFLNPEVLELLRDRVRYIPMDDPDAHRRLNYKLAGLKSKQVFSPIIQHIRATYETSLTDNELTSLLANKLHLAIDIHSGIRYRNKGFSFGLFSSESSGVGAKVIATLLSSTHIADYRNWHDSFTTFMVEGVGEIKIHNHAVDYIDHHQYALNNRNYPRKLPFGIHPKDYYREALEKEASMMAARIKGVKYPDTFNTYLDLSGTKHKQLMTAIDLYHEGLTMDHCIGTVNYSEYIKNGNGLFFHIDTPDDPHGITLFMLKRDVHTETGRLHRAADQTLWVVKECSGYQNLHVDLDDDPDLNAFLNEHFELYVPDEQRTTFQKDPILNIAAPAGYTDQPETYKDFLNRAVSFNATRGHYSVMTPSTTKSVTRLGIDIWAVHQLNSREIQLCQGMGVGQYRY